MAKTYHVNVATPMRDALFMTLPRAGVNMGTTSLLTVRGRTEGRQQEGDSLITTLEQSGAASSGGDV